MKTVLLITALILAGCRSRAKNYAEDAEVLSAAHVAASKALADFHADPQFAAGEWKIEVQTPPCDSVHNIQVIYPKDSGAPITIECNQMPVPTK